MFQVFCLVVKKDLIIIILHVMCTKVNVTDSEVRITSDSKPADQQILHFVKKNREKLKKK